MTAPARRVLVRSMTERGLSERRALAVLGMSASALRYTPGPDRNAALRARIIALAHRHRRYGVGMIYLKLRQAGEIVNYKRVERLYVGERLQIRRRRRKKVPIADRQPLVRPVQPNHVWSADFVFDRTAEGRVLKCPAMVDDATTEAVAIVPARAIGGLAVTRVLDRLASERGLPAVLRTDNGLEFCGRAMLTWAHDGGVTLRLRRFAFRRGDREIRCCVAPTARTRRRRVRPQHPWRPSAQPPIRVGTPVRVGR